MNNKLKIKYKKGAKVKSNLFVCPMGHLHKFGGYNCILNGLQANYWIYDSFWKQEFNGFTYIPIKDGMPVCYNEKTHVHTLN